MNSQIIQVFQDEADELLADLELALLELEQSPDDDELLGRIFRAMHTIKGSSAMFGFDAVAALSHEAEAVLDLVRSGSIRVSPDIVAVILQVRDMIKVMVKSPADGNAVAELREGEVVAAIRAIIASASVPVVTTETAGFSAEQVRNGTETTYRIDFRPDRDMFRRGLRPMQLLNELRELGNCRVSALTGEIPMLSDLDPELCYLGWDIELVTSAGIEAINDVFLFVGEESRISIVSEPHTNEPADHRSAVCHKPEEIQAGLQEMTDDRNQAETRNISSIRVAADKLDQLVNLVGELVTVQARLSLMSVDRNDSELVGLAEEVERLTAGLRDTALNIRMVPIGSTFSRFKRLVHDLSIELGKNVELVTTGAEAELDKTVIEKLNDPLVHLIRNSIDHGIETPELRMETGKPAIGTIHLSAVHSSDSVLVTISDDGSGIDREAVRARGVAGGLIQVGAELPDKELLNLIFAPGFSTAETVTSISGRGVGMDVVKRGVDALRGTIAIASNPGEGTAVTVRIPLTLAIIESLLVRIGNDCFVLPLAMVQECIELTGADIASTHGRHLANVRGRITPYIPLRERFAIGGVRPEIEQIVIVELEGKQVGLVVDHVIGEHQTVIKSIGRMFRKVTGISGATILGDGSVALILDVQQLIAEEEQMERYDIVYGGPTFITEELQRRESYA